MLPAGLLVSGLVVHFSVLGLHNGEGRAGTASPLPVVTLRQTAAQEAPAITASAVYATADMMDTHRTACTIISSAYSPTYHRQRSFGGG